MELIPKLIVPGGSEIIYAKVVTSTGSHLSRKNDILNTFPGAAVLGKDRFSF